MYILFDIGGTHMRIGGTHDLKELIEESVVVNTPVVFEEGMVVLKEAIQKVAHGEKIDAIAGGIAGPFSNEKKCSLVASPNLKGWIGKPFCDELEKEYSAPFYIENDSALVGLGEMHYGAGVTTGIGAYITVSTGVGGARFVDGKIDKTTIGFEPGHQIIDIDKTLCPDCDGNTLGSYISGKGTENRLGKSPKDIPQDDPLWKEYAKYLAYGLNNTIVHWSPEVLVLGGSMITRDSRIDIKQVILYLEDILTIFPTLPDIKKATLEDLGGLYGAMVLLKQRV